MSQKRGSLGTGTCRTWGLQLVIDGLGMDHSEFVNQADKLLAYSEISFLEHMIFVELLVCHSDYGTILKHMDLSKEVLYNFDLVDNFANRGFCFNCHPPSQGENLS